MKFTNEALKIVYLDFISVSISQYLKKVKRNVNRCICGIFCLREPFGAFFRRIVFGWPKVIL